MKVLHLLKTSVGGTWALRQVQELARLEIQVEVALPPGGPRVEEYRRAGIAVHLDQFDAPVSRPWQWPSVSSRLRELVRSVRPDLIHSHFVGTTLSARLALRNGFRTPRLFQVPGPLHLELAVTRRAEILTSTEQDSWIASCALTRRIYLESGIPGDRVFLSYYGLDLEPYESPVQGRLRRELGVRTGIPLIGMVAYMYAPRRYLGRFRGIKGHEDFIEAIALTAAIRPDVLGVVIGGAWGGADGYEHELREYGRRRCGDRIVFLGSRDDVGDLYPDLDVVAHPSLSENVGGAAESLLWAVPTIATRVGGFPDLITDGKTGWLVPPRDPQALSRAILRVLSAREEARRVAREGQLLTRELFDVRRTAREVAEIYARTLERA